MSISGMQYNTMSISAMQHPENLKPAQSNKVKAKHLKIILTDLNMWFGCEGLAC